MSSNHDEPSAKFGFLPHIKGWFVLLAVLTVAAAYSFHLYRQKQEIFVNAYHFRTLQEVTTEFNNRLAQFTNLIKYGESETTIKSLFPSYERKSIAERKPIADGDDREANASDTVACSDECETGPGKSSDKEVNPSCSEVQSYNLIGDILALSCGGHRYNISLQEVMPEPPLDFSLLIVANKHHQVVTHTGGAAGLSITDTHYINREIQVRDSQDWLKLAAGKGSETPETDQPLPGYSTYVDLPLTTGKSRVFVQPFKLGRPIALVADPNTPIESTSDGTGALQTWYLAGVQSDTAMGRLDNNRWNFSLLSLSLVALVFAWALTRLLMLSRHQAIGTLFYRVSLLSTYLLFIALVALLVAFGAKDATTAVKHAKAEAILSDIGQNLEGELYELFSELRPFHSYYSNLINSAQANTGEARCNALLDSGNQAFPTTQSSPIHSLVWSQEHDSDKPVVVSENTQASQCSVLEYRRQHSEDDRASLPSWTAFSRINIFPASAHIETTPNLYEIFDPPGTDTAPRPRHLLDVFVMDHQGQQILPMFYFIEVNKVPASYSLAHRDYFRNVRDRNGWNARFDPRARTRNRENAQCNRDDTPLCIVEKNFYIQRLLNLNTGTRGTTLAMPLRSNTGNKGVNGQLLGADIQLPALSLTPWLDPARYEDMLVMVVDRGTGDVLYHMDDDRSMIENLYRSGQSTANISQMIRSSRIGHGAVPGYYHGQAGDFLAQALPLSQWAVIAFIPSASTDSLMSNTFLTTAIGLTGILGLLALVAAILRRWSSQAGPSQYSGFLAPVNFHDMVLAGLIFVAFIYFLYYVLSVVSLFSAEHEKDVQWPLWLLIIMPLLVTWIAWYCWRQSRAVDELPRPFAGQAVAFGAVALCLVAITSTLGSYLDRIGTQPRDALDWYYGSNLKPARLNQELSELHDIALTLYPNSIKRGGSDPLDYLPLDPAWRDTLEGHDTPSPSGNGISYQQFRPENVGTFSQLTFATDPVTWARRYLLGLEPTGRNHNIDRTVRVSAGDILRHITVFGAAFAGLCCLLTLVYRRLLKARLIGTDGFLQHLGNIAGQHRPQHAYAPRPELTIDLRGIVTNADDGRGKLKDSEALAARQALKAQVLAACPALKESGQSQHLIEARIDFHLRPLPSGSRGKLEDSDGPAETPWGLVVSISRLENCLGESAPRAALLKLLRQLKAEYDHQALMGIELHLDLHAFEALLLKAHTLGSQSDAQTETHAETHAKAHSETMSRRDFLDWSRLLMDFGVTLPDELESRIDPHFVAQECRCGRLLEHLPTLGFGKSGGTPLPARGRRRWLGLHDTQRSGSEWATINGILLKAGALFRYQWETCSSAEKLTLYHLAKNKRVNAANTQLLEQLALQGLIAIERGKIRILNHSFAYFVRHAEDSSTLQELVLSGDSGVWNDYRAPVTLVALLLLGAIALTSGSSLYMIAASLLGLLGTIGSLVGSASLIRENLR